MATILGDKYYIFSKCHIMGHRCLVTRTPIYKDIDAWWWLRGLLQTKLAYGYVLKYKDIFGKEEERVTMYPITSVSEFPDNEYYGIALFTEPMAMSETGETAYDISAIQVFTTGEWHPIIGSPEQQLSYALPTNVGSFRSIYDDAYVYAKTKGDNIQ